MIEIRRPAPPLELAEMMERLTPEAVKAKHGGSRRLAFTHIAHTRSFAAFDGAVCLACGGLWNEGAGRMEAWFACRPEAASRLLEILRAARLTLSLIAETENVEIRARVAAGWRPGRRIARALGFRLEREVAGTEIWLKGRPWVISSGR